MWSYHVLFKITIIFTYHMTIIENNYHIAIPSPTIVPCPVNQSTNPLASGKLAANWKITMINGELLFSMGY